ncbi:MAG TPA: hypothetical protein VMT18_03650 [Planctomycetota bacterium]|nr:hypothetical protein [Planctomycetota bacterium]
MLPRPLEVQLARLSKHLAEQGISLELSDAAKNELAREGKRVIQKRVQNLLADRILAGELGAGDTATIDFDGARFELTRCREEPEPAGAAN